jgi:DNA polymerase
VPADGPQKADILLVGEAPGAEEDYKGTPFWGPAGETLNGLLHHANIPRPSIVIDNVVQCRPPNNRNPENDEIAACYKRLKRTIEVVNPKVIACLGAISAAVVTGKSLDWRGMVVTSNKGLGSRPTLITYHPAYVRRVYGHTYSTALLDLEKLLKPTPKEYKPNYVINPPFETFKHIMESWRDTWVAVDIETISTTENPKDSLNPYLNQMIGIAFCGEPEYAVHASGSALTKYRSYITEYLTTHKQLLWQNNLFDRTTLGAKGITGINRYRDTFDNMYILCSDIMPRELDFIRSLYTNVIPYKKQFKKKGGVQEAGTQELGIYNCRDVDVTLQAAMEQEKYLDQTLVQRHERYSNTALQMRLRGVCVSKVTLAKHYAKLLPIKEKLSVEFTKKYGVDIASPKQLSTLLFDKLKFIPPHWALKKTMWSTDDKVLEYLIKGCIGNPEGKEALQHIQKYRTTQVKASTFCEGVYSRIMPDGRVHPDWKTTGTDTSRWACTDPNMMNFPNEMRNMMIPEKDKVFYGADYDRIELWVAALLSGDNDLLDLLKEGKPEFKQDKDTGFWSYKYVGGRNPHEEILAEIEKKFPLTKHLGPVQAKLRAKAVVFGTLYKRSPESIAREFGVSKIVAETWQESVFYRFPKLAEHFNTTVPNFFKRHKYTQTFHGFKKYAANLPQAVNTPIQGTAAEIQYDGAHTLTTNGFGLNISVHDQLVCEEVKDKRTFERFIELMEGACPKLHHRFPIEAKMGRNWYEVS